MANTEVGQVSNDFEQKLDEQIPEKVKTQAEIYDDEIKQLKEDLAKIDDLAKLDEMEAEVAKLIDENAEKQKTTEYELPDSTTFRGQLVSRAKVGEYVADFLSCQEVGWQMTLGLFDLISFWKNIKDTSKITYEYYDATLRLLGQQKYRGFESLRRILTANALFSSAHDNYINDLSYTYYLADKHSAIMDRQDAIHALNDTGVGVK